MTVGIGKRTSEKNSFADFSQAFYRHLIQMAALQAFLDAHRVPGGTSGSTHGGCGSFIFDHADEEELHRLLAAAPREQIPYLVECALPSGCAPLVLDMDFSAAVAPPGGQRLWEAAGLREGWTAHLARALYDAYAELVVDMPNRITMFVLQRPHGYMSATKSKYVDGIHIHAPQLFCEMAVHRRARELTLGKLDEDARSILHTMPQPVWDLAYASSSRGGKLAMYGTGKRNEPNCLPYALVEELEVSEAYVTSEVDCPARAPRDMVRITSVRIEWPELHLRAPLPSLSEAAVSGAGAACAPEVAGEVEGEGKAVTPEQWLDVKELVGMLSVERATISGIREQHKLNDTMGWAQVLNRLHQLSNGSEEAKQVALTFSKTATCWWSSPEQCEASFKQFNHIWGGSPKYLRKRLSGSVSMEESNKLSLSDLHKWARDDSPAAYTGHTWRVPIFSPTKFTYTPPTPEEVKKLVAEVMPTLLASSPEGWKLVKDKHGVLPFNHRFLFGAAEDPNAGLSDFSQLVPAPVVVEVGEAPKSTVAIYSHLGTGKTSLFKYISGQRGGSGAFLFPKVCYISARRSFTQSQMSEMEEQVETTKFNTMRSKNKDGTVTIKHFGKGRVEYETRSFGFKSYMNERQLSVAEQPRIFCQTESLHKYLVDGELPVDLRFDVLILDELESLVASLKPSPTMHGKLLDNLKVFTALVSSADTVVGGDAFLTQRSLDVLRELRKGHPLRLILNHANPYAAGAAPLYQSRTLHRCFVITSLPKRKMSQAEKDKWRPREDVAGSVISFNNRLVADLKAGLKVVAVWGSRKAGLAFDDYVKDTFYDKRLMATKIQQWVRWLKVNPRTTSQELRHRLRVTYRSPQPRQFANGKPLPITFDERTAFMPVLAGTRRKGLRPLGEASAFHHKFFHSGNKATPGDLNKLNEQWADLNYLAYSPTITVGVNYNPVPFHPPQLPNMFQRLYIYACRYGATPRDLMQASVRVRTIQPPPGEPHLIYVIDHRGSPPGFVGLDTCLARIKELKDATLSAAQQLKLLTAREAAQGLKQLWSPAKMRSAPPWYDLLLARNLNEANVSSSFPEQVVESYLELCGYTGKLEPEFGGEEVLVPNLSTLPPSYGEVPCVSKAVMMELKQVNAGTEESLSPLYQLAINKYYFHERMGLPTFDWTPPEVFPKVSWPEWATPKKVDLLWRGKVDVIWCDKPCPFLGEPHHSCNPAVSYSADGYVDKAARFKQIALAKMATHADTLAACLTMDYHASGGTLDYSKNTMAAKAQVMSLITAELGLEHAGKARSWSPDELWALVPKFTEERQWPDLEGSSLKDLSLAQRATLVFGLRDRSGRATETHYADGTERTAPCEVRESSRAAHLAEHLGMVFNAWCLSSITCDFERREVVSSEGAVSTRVDKVRPPNTPKSPSGKVSTYYNELQKTPEWKAATSPQEREQLKEAARVKWEKDYPLITPVGMTLVPWQGACGSDPTTGLLWDLVPPYQAPTTSLTTHRFRDDEVDVE